MTFGDVKKELCKSYATTQDNLPLSVFKLRLMQRIEKLESKDTSLANEFKKALKSDLKIVNKYLGVE